MISNEELLDLLETEGSIEYLFSQGKLSVDELEDTHLAELVEEALPILHDIQLYISHLQEQRDDRGDL